MDGSWPQFHNYYVSMKCQNLLWTQKKSNPTCYGRICNIVCENIAEFWTKCHMQILEISLPDLAKNFIVQIPADAMSILPYAKWQSFTAGLATQCSRGIAFLLLCPSVDYLVVLSHCRVHLLATYRCHPNAPCTCLYCSSQNAMHLIITNQSVY